MSTPQPAAEIMGRRPAARRTGTVNGVNSTCECTRTFAGSDCGPNASHERTELGYSVRHTLAAPHSIRLGAVIWPGEPDICGNHDGLQHWWPIPGRQPWAREGGRVLGPGAGCSSGSASLNSRSWSVGTLSVYLSSRVNLVAKLTFRYY